MILALGRACCRGVGGVSVEALAAATLRRSTAGAAAGSAAPFSSGALPADIEARTAAINDAFAQAREDIADARDDAETVYFNESAQVARESVEGVLAQWRALLDAVGDSQRGELQRAMGLKMEQLRAELKELDELHA